MTLPVAGSSLSSARIPVRKATDRVKTWAVRAVVLSLGLCSVAAVDASMMTARVGLLLQTLLLLGYLWHEVLRLRRFDQHLIWLSPPVLTSLLTFSIPFGISNVLYLMPEDTLLSLGIEPVVTIWMARFMWLVLLGASALWIGYTSVFGASLARGLARHRVTRRWMVSSTRVSKTAIYVALGISLLAKLWQVNLEVFGYASSYDALIAGAAYREYLSLADSLGKVALVAVAVQCYSPGGVGLTDRPLLLIVLAFEVLFGFLSGFKSAVVMPFIIVAFAHYTQRNRFPRWLPVAITLSVGIALATIDAFRTNINSDASFRGTSVTAIAAALGDSERGLVDSSAPAVALSVLKRSHLTYVASLGLEYAAEGTQSDNEPAFLRDIVMSPAHALVPRFIWDSKPLQNIGLWYTTEVMQLEQMSSTAMSAVTYLYFAGGAVAVIGGFFLVGVIQRGLFGALREFPGGGTIVMIGITSLLVSIDSAFNTFFIGVIRLVPLLVIVQWLLLRGPSRSAVSPTCVG